jgi:hypothetical protein
MLLSLRRLKEAEGLGVHVSETRKRLLGHEYVGTLRDRVDVNSSLTNLTAHSVLSLSAQQCPERI